MIIKTANDNNINSLLKVNKTILLKLGATWCGPCKSIKPVLDSIAKDRSQTLIVLDMDIDESPITSNAMQIMSVPTMILFIDGKEVSRKIGSISKIKLESWIDSEVNY